jgi:hypothetical protein
VASREMFWRLVGKRFLYDGSACSECDLLPTFPLIARVYTPSTCMLHLKFHQTSPRLRKHELGYDSVVAYNLPDNNATSQTPMNQRPVSSMVIECKDEDTSVRYNENERKSNGIKDGLARPMVHGDDRSVTLGP